MAGPSRDVHAKEGAPDHPSEFEDWALRDLQRVIRYVTDGRAKTERQALGMAYSLLGRSIAEPPSPKAPKDLVGWAQLVASYRPLALYGAILGWKL